MQERVYPPRGQGDAAQGQNQDYSYQVPRIPGLPQDPEPELEVLSRDAINYLHRLVLSNPTGRQAQGGITAAKALLQHVDAVQNRRQKDTEPMGVEAFFQTVHARMVQASPALPAGAPVATPTDPELGDPDDGRDDP